MTYTLEQGPKSNYKVVITVTPADQTAAKETVLKDMQKDVKMPGFRPGHVPLAMVEKQMQPEYLKMSIYESIITNTLKAMVEKETDKRFIGMPYDIDFQEAEGEDAATTVTVMLDVYPEVTVKDDSWKNHQLTAVDVSVPQNELDEAVMTFKKQYADYEDTDAIADGTVSKVNYIYRNAAGEEIDKSVMYVGDDEAASHPELKTLFWGKKGGEVVTIAYDEDKLPKIVHYTKGADKPHDVVFTIGEVKKIVLPTFGPDNIKKYFGEDAKVTTEAEVLQMIEESMKEEKFNKSLMAQVEEILQKMMKDGFGIAIPQTMVNEEKEQRVKNMKERFGGEESFNKYVEQLGEAKFKAMEGDIARASKESLEKFLVFRKWVELLGITVDREKKLDPEYQIYEKMTGEKPFKSAFLDQVSQR